MGGFVDTSRTLLTIGKPATASLLVGSFGGLPVCVRVPRSTQREGVGPHRGRSLWNAVMPTDTELHKAAHNGDLGKVKQLIEDGEIAVNEPGAAERRALQR